MWQGNLCFQLCEKLSIQKGYFFFITPYLCTSFYLFILMFFFMLILPTKSIPLSVNFILATTVTHFPSTVLKGVFCRVKRVTFSISWDLAFKYIVLCGFKAFSHTQTHLILTETLCGRQRDAVSLVALSLGSKDSRYISFFSCKVGFIIGPTS